MVLIYVAETGAADLTACDRIAGLSFAARVFHSARRAGYDRVVVWAPAHGETLAREAGRVSGIAVEVARTTPEWQRIIDAGTQSSTPLTAVTVVTPGVVVSPGVLAAAERLSVDADVPVRVAVPAGPDWPLTGVYRTTMGDARDIDALSAFVRTVQAATWPMPTGPDIALKRAPLVARASTRAALPDVEQIVRRAMFKPNDTCLARLNRRMSLPISVWLIEHTTLSANALSILLVGLGFVAAWLFGRGSYVWGIAGALLSLAASILDGSDGEIARLKYEESAFGCWVETIGDYSYYLALFAGMTVGAVRSTGERLFAGIGVAAFAGLVLTLALLVVLRHRATPGNPEGLQQATVARFYADGSWWTWLVARISFVATRAAMPYGIAVLAILHAVPLVVVLACIGANVYWISLALMWPALMPGGGPGRTRVRVPAHVRARPAGLGAPTASSPREVP